MVLLALLRLCWTQLLGYSPSPSLPLTSPAASLPSTRLYSRLSLPLLSLLVLSSFAKVPPFPFYLLSLRVHVVLVSFCPPCM